MSASEEILKGTLSISHYVLFFLVTLVGLLTVYHFWFQTLRYVRLGNKLPAMITTLPLIGDMHITLTTNTPFEIMKEALRVYDEKKDTVKTKIIRFWLGSHLSVFLLDPRDIELILGSTKHLEKSKNYNTLQPFLGDGILITKGKNWKLYRQMIVPTFHQSILKTFIPVFNEHARKLVETLKKEKDNVFDIHHYIVETSVDILQETAMGLNHKNASSPSFDYAQGVMDLCHIQHIRLIKIWLTPDFIFNLTSLARREKKILKSLKTFTNNVFKQKLEEYEISQTNAKISSYRIEAKVDSNDLDGTEVAGEKKRMTFLDLMIQASKTEGNQMSDQQIVDQVNTVMFAGHDTISATASFVLCILGVHQNIQDKVFEEIKKVFQGSNRDVTYTDVVNLKYLERVILETLRLYSTVPIIGRTISEDIKLVSADYIIPKGTTIALPIFQVHRDPDYYPNPLKFDPDNFLPERCQKRPFYSFIPFSAGPRDCLGRKFGMLEIKILMVNILRHYKIVSPVNESEFQLQADLILKRADGFRIRLEKRN